MNELDAYRLGKESDEDRKQLVKCVEAIIATSYQKYKNYLIERHSPDLWRVCKEDFTCENNAKAWIDKQENK